MRIHLTSGMHMNVCRNGEQSPPVTHEICCQPEAKTWGKALGHVGESRSAFVFPGALKNSNVWEIIIVDHDRAVCIVLDWKEESVL